MVKMKSLATEFQTRVLDKPPLNFFLWHFQEICLTSSLHGAYYLAKPKLLFVERFIWFWILFGMGNMIFYYYSFFITRYYENSIYMNIERDHLHWESYFPPITICAKDKMNETALAEFIAEKGPGNATEMESFLRDLVNLSFENLENGLADYEEIESKDFLQIIHRLSNSFGNTADIYGGPRLKFYPVMTEMGACSTINSKVLDTLSWEFMLNGSRAPTQTLYKAFYAQGEAEAVVMGLNYSGNYDIFYGSGVPTLLQRIPVPEDSGLCTNIQFKSVDIYSSKSVRRLHRYQRKCLFADEKLNLKHSPHVYYYELCIRECRITQMLKVCGCLPPFYPLASAEETYCTGSHIACIGLFFDKITNITENCRDCLKSCDDTSFQLSSIQHVQWLSGKNGLRWELILSKTRFRREVKFSVIDLLVAFGSCSGFWLGISCISMMEFFYFYFIQIFCAYRAYQRNYGGKGVIKSAKEQKSFKN